eukprot:TRINITY_DN59973_c0_g1_i1.p3 TRINITY_DN59973_c0_g1~~TRINITY_DN59973_c0_g1_i1.p3  ORF type:complete len:121 (+),score=2.99 TRINITY_DN59973_c0_g1_i1:3-365(+)
MFFFFFFFFSFCLYGPRGCFHGSLMSVGAPSPKTIRVAACARPCNCALRSCAACSMRASIGAAREGRNPAGPRGCRENQISMLAGSVPAATASRYQAGCRPRPVQVWSGSAGLAQFATPF